MASDTPSITVEEYIKDRLVDQIDWYDNKSKWNQTWFKRLRAVEIIAAAMIPFLVGYSKDSIPSIKVLIGLIGIAIACASGLMALFKFHEHWIQYRITAELLRHHKFLFLTRTSPYDGDTAFHTLVKNIEQIISSETSGWATYSKEKTKSNTTVTTK